MNVLLTKKLAECIDGVDLSDYQVGDVLDLPAREARLLLAEQWAVPHRPARKGPPRVARPSAKQTDPQSASPERYPGSPPQADARPGDAPGGVS